MEMSDNYNSNEESNDPSSYLHASVLKALIYFSYQIYLHENVSFLRLVFIFHAYAVVEIYNTY